MIVQSILDALTGPTAHKVMVLYTGVAITLAGMLLLPVWKALGPTHPGHITFGWKVRGVVLGYGFILFLRGVTVIFPGQAVQVQHMSIFMPLGASGALVAHLVLADLVLHHRLPPALIERFFNAARLITAGRDADLPELAMALPIAGDGGLFASADHAPRDELVLTSPCNPALRIALIVFGIVALVAVLAVAVTAGAAELFA